MTKTVNYDETYGEETGVTYTYGESDHSYTQTKNEYTGLVTAIRTPIERISYTYDGFGRVTAKTRTGSGFTNTVNYTYAANKSNTSYTSPTVLTYGGTPVKYRYTYDSRNITMIQNVDTGAIVTSYTYDAIGRLTRANTNGYNTEVYAYDSRGNITSKKSYAYTTGTVGTATSTKTYTYDSSNKVLTFNSLSCAYDANGNPTTYKGSVLTWSRGRYLSAAVNGTARYYYNAEGIRVRKTVGSTTTHYILDGNRIIAEYSGSAYKKYFYDESGIAGMIYNGATYFFVKNLQGDVEHVYNSGGTLVGS